jgi:hypothetical protein
MATRESIRGISVVKTQQENTTEGTLHPKFSTKLREASLFGAFTELSTKRFQKYVLQPKHFLRNGWLLDPELELNQRSVRAYVLGEFPTNPDNSNSIGQRVEINRKDRVATLETNYANQRQTIEFDMTSMEVTKNEVTVKS